MEQLLTKVRQELASAEAASADTSSYARDGDVKSDGKYLSLIHISEPTRPY